MAYHKNVIIQQRILKVIKKNNSYLTSFDLVENFEKKKNI